MDHLTFKDHATKQLRKAALRFRLNNCRFRVSLKTRLHESNGVIFEKFQSRQRLAA